VKTQRSSTDDACLKLIGRVENLEDLGDLPDVVHSFNNKPVLLTKSCTVHVHDNGKILEITFDVRMWNFLARKSFAMLNGELKNAVVSLALLVEGKKETELPEQIIGCVQLDFLDVKNAKFVSLASLCFVITRSRACFT
jgi:hypothetical protein